MQRHGSTAYEPSIGANGTLGEAIVHPFELTEKRLRLPSARRILADAWLHRSTRLQHRGAIRQAVTACRRARRLDPANADVHCRLAMNLRRLGENDAALAAAKRARRLRPSSPIAVHLANALDRAPASRAPIGYVGDLFDRFAVDFDDRMTGLLRYRVPRLLARRIRPVVRRHGRFDHTLDLGCGTGLAGAALRRFTRRLTGVDISRSMLSRAAGKSIYDTVVCADILDALADRSMRVDLIVAADVFIYLGDLDAVFRRAAARLTPDGLFAFSTERGRHMPYRLRRSGRFTHHPEYIRTLARRHGFVVTSAASAGIRIENQRWVDGDIFILQPCGASAPREPDDRPRGVRRTARDLLQGSRPAAAVAALFRRRRR